MVVELRAKGLEEDINNLRTELESLRNKRKELEQEVRVMCSILDEARNDRACLEGDVLSLTKAVALLEVELTAEGPKAVAAYKASRGFESGLEKMGRVKYEFRYQVTLEWFREKHMEIGSSRTRLTKGSPIETPVDDLIPCFSPLDPSGGLFVGRKGRILLVSQYFLPPVRVSS
ncbi:hypothetical protein BHE74_00017031 [Ensete ventricosum]|nr:hypothetical protein BHE74_00017031 [Ensete ventricosum]